MEAHYWRERQLTHGPGGRIVTNFGVWSPDGKSIVYDTRSDAAGDVFDGRRIEIVDVEKGAVKILYESQNGACCGVATFHPTEPKVVFILGPANPTPEWSYNAYHRRGVIVAADRPGKIVPLDARNIVPPFTPGALRGGSHVHVWNHAGTLVSFTYEDHFLAENFRPTVGGAINQRNVGVCVSDRAVEVPKTHPRNKDGTYFSFLVTQTTPHPTPGSDEIQKACEEGWIGTNGYLDADGKRRRRALAFQGEVVTEKQETIAEVFVVDLPDDITESEKIICGEGPLEGTETRLPFPPIGVRQRRLTFTATRKYSGIQGPRHWLRSSPDGSRIAFLMKDEAGVVQIWTISPCGGEPVQVSRNAFSIASAFTWNPDGKFIAHTMDGSVCRTDMETGETIRLTPHREGEESPRPEACVFSPDGHRIAYVRRTAERGGIFNQIFVVEV